ncbi:MAG: hypothetical protein M1834_006471 [Cirrosporium novae-zelandiae]|nr:MAG: hypothetical protein M1834_006471 [Cirrosporium novae-zelandiae]
MSDSQHIAYISARIGFGQLSDIINYTGAPKLTERLYLDIGAQGLKPLFITGSVITTIFLDLSFASERWLRHKGFLVQNHCKWDKALSILAIIFSIAGTCGLILLSIFDTWRHPRLHDGFLLLFIAGYIIAAIFLCAEYQRLGIHYRQHRILRISFWIKLCFIIIEFGLAIGFGICTVGSHKSPNAGAVIEWVIALIFTFWVLSFLIDLLPAIRTKKHIPQGLKELERAVGMTEANGENSIERYLTNDSRGPAGLAEDNAVNRGYRAV